MLCHSVFMLRNSNYLIRDLEKKGYKTGYEIYLLHVILAAVSVGVTSFVKKARNKFLKKPSFS